MVSIYELEAGPIAPTVIEPLATYDMNIFTCVRPASRI